MNYLDEYYNNHDEEGRLLSRHGQVEYLTTMKYIRECLEETAEPNILEVGAGTGRYSVTLAKEGYRVTAVELIQHNLEILKSKLDGTEPIRALQGNALDLSFLPDGAYDLTMVLGPMYHLYTREDKVRALAEAMQVSRSHIQCIEDGDNFSVAVLLEACRVLEVTPNELLDQDDDRASYMMRFSDVLKDLNTKEMEIITSAAEGMKKGFQEQ